MYWITTKNKGENRRDRHIPLVDNIYSPVSTQQDWQSEHIFSIKQSVSSRILLCVDDPSVPKPADFSEIFSRVILRGSRRALDTYVIEYGLIRRPGKAPQYHPNCPVIFWTPKAACQRIPELPADSR